MPEETTTITVKQTANWIEWIRKFLPTLLLLGSGIVSLVLFWDTQKNHTAKIQALEIRVTDLEKYKANYEALKDLTDKVNSQYTRAKEDRENESKAIEEVADWMHEQIGYEKATQDLKTKK